MEKHKVNLDRPNISAEEVKAKQNFDQIISNYHITPKSFFQKGWFWGSVGLASVAALAVFSFTSLNSSDDGNDKKNTSMVTDGKGLPPDTPCIKPPLEGKDQAYQKFTIDPTKDNQIVTSAGTEINIPANSFQNNQNEFIQHTIEIQIREFYDKSEVFLSGIPMAYDSSGTKYSLETAGMIEIRGFDGQNELFELENEMEINLATNNSDNDFNLYYLDETGKKWNYISALNTNENSSESEGSVDVTELKERNQELLANIEVLEKEIVLIEKTKPLKPKKLDDS